MNDTKKQSFVDKFNTKIGKFAHKIGQQKQLASIRDAFATFMPFIIVASFAILIANVFVAPYGLIGSQIGVTEGTHEGWWTFWTYVEPLFNGLEWGTLTVFSIYIVFLIGYFHTGTYTDYNKTKQLYGGLVSVAAFFALNPFAAASSVGGGAQTYLGTRGLIVALIFGLLSSYLFVKLSSVKKLKLNMPPSVPQVIANSFNVLIPLSLTLLSITAIQTIWGAIALGAGFGWETTQHNVYYITLIDPVFGDAVITVPEDTGLFALINAGKIADEAELASFLNNEYSYIAVDSLIGTNWVVYDPVQNEYVLATNITASQIEVGTWQNLQFFETKSKGEYYYIFSSVEASISEPLSSFGNHWTSIILINVYFSKIKLFFILFLFCVFGRELLFLPVEFLADHPEAAEPVPAARCASLWHPREPSVTLLRTVQVVFTRPDPVQYEHTLQGSQASQQRGNPRVLPDP